MKLSKQSLAAYIALLIVGVPAVTLGLVGIGNLGGLLVVLLLASGLPMTAVAFYGLIQHRNLADLPMSAKASLSVGLISFLCFVSLMTLVIIALKDFS